MRDAAPAHPVGESPGQRFVPSRPQERAQAGSKAGDLATIYNRGMIRLAALLLLALPAFAQVADGDAQFARRAEGARGGRAQAGPVDASIAAYERAIAQNPADLVAHARLLRAIRFKGAYVAATKDEKKATYGKAKDAGARALSAVQKALAGRNVKPDAAEREVATAARAIPGAAEIYLWDSVNWGEWALAYGKLAAAREGAADRIRRHATIAHLADPKLEAGAPSRVLGRLHDQTPRIPFVTGWASSKEAVRFLTESSTYDPQNKLTLLFLAEAMAANDAKAKPRAVEILRRVLATPPHPDYPVEEAAAQEDARRVLTAWGIR
jgi:tetratricopeptide (TPR) repeat protein